MPVRIYQNIPARILDFDLLSYTNTSDKYVINPVTGVVTGPFGSNVKPLTRIGGKRYIQGERSSQNVARQSDRISEAGTWTLNASSTVVSSNLSPIGTTCDTLIPDGNVDVHVAYQGYTAQTVGAFFRNNGYNYGILRLYTGSAWRSICVNLTTGECYTPSGPEIVAYHSVICVDNWIYFEASLAGNTSVQIQVGASNNSTGAAFAGDGVKGVDIWGVQGRASRLYSDSIIRTTTGAVTRNKDQIYLPAASVTNELKDSVKFTLYPEWSSDQVTTGDIRNICEFADTTQNIQCYYDGSDKMVKVAGRAKQFATDNTNCVAVYNSYAYITSLITNTVKTVNLVTGAVSTLYSGNPTSGIGVNSSYVYFLVNSGVDTGVWRMGLDGSGTTKLTDSVSNPQYAYIDSTKFYWADYTSGKVKSYTFVGGAVTDEITGLTGPFAVAVDATNLYWCGDGKISYRPIGGGATVDLKTGISSIRGLAVDSEYAYWTIDAGGLYKTPKILGTPTTTIHVGTLDGALYVNDYRVFIGTGTDGLYIIFKSPFSSGATTHSAYQKLEVTLNRVAGTLKLGGFTTGDGTTVGTSWNRTDSNLYIGMDATESKQWDGLIGEPEVNTNIFEGAFETEWAVSGDAEARTITLPLINTRAEGALAYNAIVDWGDGTATSNITAYDDADRIHTYGSNGTYRVKIVGTSDGWSFNNGGDKLKITKVINWGNGVINGFKYLYAGFYGCANLTSLASGGIPASGTGVLTNGFELAFTSCGALTSIPSDLFSKHGSVTTSAYKNTFNGCTSLVSIPTGLFDAGVLASTSAFRETFRSCSGITSIPTDLFRYNVLVSSSGFESTFRDCTAVTGIPTDLFRYNTALTSSAFSNTFNGCTGIASLPTDLFRYNTLVSNSAFNGTFSGCTSLATLPVDLFRYNTTAGSGKFYGAFGGCTALATLPDGIFDYNTTCSGNSFDYTFGGCTALATLPANLFRNNTAITSWEYCFYGTPKLQQRADIFFAVGEEATRFLNQSPSFSHCFDRASFTGTQGVAPALWSCSYGTGTPTKTDCWNGAGNSLASLSNYGDIPGDWV